MIATIEDKKTASAVFFVRTFYELFMGFCWFSRMFKKK